jgi:hypothetical protein
MELMASSRWRTNYMLLGFYHCIRQRITGPLKRVSVYYQELAETMEHQWIRHPKLPKMSQVINLNSSSRP